MAMVNAMIMPLLNLLPLVSVDGRSGGGLGDSIELALPVELNSGKGCGVSVVSTAAESLSLFDCQACSSLSLDWLQVA